MAPAPSNVSASCETEILIEPLFLPSLLSTVPLHTPQELQTEYRNSIVQSKKRQRDRVLSLNSTHERQDLEGFSAGDAFLNHCPTLELQPTEVFPLIPQLIQQWFSAPALRSHLKKDLSRFNDSYFQNIYNRPDKEEADRFRRVDPNRSRKVLISNSETEKGGANTGTSAAVTNRGKRIANCVSCLTQGQHHHYKDIVKRYMRNRRRLPGNSNSHPDTTIVLDLIRSEQAQFLLKFKHEICECIRCAEDAKDQHPSQDRREPSHDCLNHNFLGDAMFRRFAQYHRIQRLSERIEGFLTLAKIAAGVRGFSSSSDNPPGIIDVAESKTSTDERNRVYNHSHDSFGHYGRLDTAGLSMQIHLVGATDEKSTTRSSFSDTDALLSHREEFDPDGSTISLPFSLNVNFLAELSRAAYDTPVPESKRDGDDLYGKNARDTQLTGRLETPNEMEERWNSAVDADCIFHEPIINAVSVVLDSTPSAEAKAQGGGSHSKVGGFALTVSFEAMLTLLTAHLDQKSEGIDPLHNGFRLPILVRVAPQKAQAGQLIDSQNKDTRFPTSSDVQTCELHLEVGNPFPREKESRRGILTETMKYLIRASPSIPSSFQAVGAKNLAWSGPHGARTTSTQKTDVDERLRTLAHSTNNPHFCCCAALKLSRPDDDPMSSSILKPKELKTASFFSKPLYLNVVHHASGFEPGGRPLFALVKVDYLNKNPDLRPTAASSVESKPLLMHESFSTTEVLRVCLIFRCFPTAVVRVYYVNAYFAYVFAIKEFTRATWEAVLTSHSVENGPSEFGNDFYMTPGVTETENFQYAFDSLYDILCAASQRVVAKALEMLLAGHGDQVQLDRAVHFHYILAKLNKSKKTLIHEAASDPHEKKNHKRDAQSGERSRLGRKYDLRLYHVEELYPNFYLRFDKRREAESWAFVEGISPEVTDREYLPPDNWIFSDRIPFTFPPRKASTPP